MAEPGEILPERNVDMASLYDVLQRSKTSIEDIVGKMLAIKKEASPESHLRELVTQVLLNFVSLRQVSYVIFLLIIHVENTRSCSHRFEASSVLS